MKCQHNLDLIREIAANLGVSVDNVNAVIYGEKTVHGEKLLAIMDSLSNDGRGGVYVCAVWKGETPLNAIQNVPRYDSYAQIIEGLNLYLYTQGYASRLLVSNLQLADYAYFEHILLQHPNAGLVNVASYFTGDLRKACDDYHRPLVFLDYPSGEDPANEYIISIKSEAVIAEVVSYLYSLGHRRIAFIQGLLEKQSALDRYKGYCSGLTAVGLELDEALVFAGNWDIPAGKAAAEQFMMLASPPTAIIASNDLMAFGVMQTLEHLEIHVPKDVSVVGFDDTALASMTKPTLTSVRTPLTDMGYKAGECIVKLLEGEALEPRHTELPLELVKRESTGAAPK